MKTEKLRITVTGILLAFAVSAGAAGCLWTGFDLNVTRPEGVWLVCGLASLLWGVCLMWKWGGTAALCLLALWAGFLWHRGEAGIQILQLLHRISYGYDRAYGWGVLRFVDTPWNMGIADYPLQIVGCLVAICVCSAVCRWKITWPAVAVSLLPLISCLVVTDTVPEELHLYLLLTGIALLLLTAAVRRTDPAQAGTLLLLLTLPVAAAMALLFHLVPQDSYVNHSADVRESILSWVESLPDKLEDTGQEIASAVQVSEDETVNLETLGRQSSLAYPVMEVTTQWSGPLYLRGQDYDAYTGTGWTATPHRSENFSCTGEAAGTVTVTTRKGLEICYLPYYPQSILTGGNLNNAGKEKTYSIPRWVLPDNWRSLVRRRSEGNWESEAVFATTLAASRYLDSARYLLLPIETRERAEALLESVLEDRGTATEDAEVIAAYVRGSARYDRDTGRMPSGEEDFALWFLEDSETGYCVHFATATVVLLRAADIPARYVTGYLAHCRPGETVTVTADTAHAWAEYYEPQLACWIPLEATPSEGLPMESSPAPSQTQTVTQPSSPEETTAPTAPAETKAPSATESRPVTLPSTPETEEKQISPAWLWATALIGLAVLQRPVRIALRRRKYRDTPNEQALGYWQEILLLAKLCNAHPPRELRYLAQKAKFSQHTLTEGELAQMNAYISDSVELLKRSPWYKKLLYRYVFAAW